MYGWWRSQRKNMSSNRQSLEVVLVVNKNRQGVYDLRIFISSVLYMERHPSWDYREYELDLNHTLGTDRKIRTAKHKIVPTPLVSSTHTPIVDSTGSRQYDRGFHRLLAVWSWIPPALAGMVVKSVTIYTVCPEKWKPLAKAENYIIVQRMWCLSLHL